jgi:hypothetical protein
MTPAKLLAPPLLSGTTERMDSAFPRRWVRLIVLAGVAVLLARLAVTLPARATELDFSHYYVTSRLLLEGRPVYGTPLAPEYARYGFTVSDDIRVPTNPPPLVWLFAPLSLLPVRPAFWLWTLLQLASLTAVLAWTIGRGRWLIWLLVLASPPVFYHLGTGQTQLLVAALLVGAYRLRGRCDPAAVALVCAAGLLKLFPLALLPWFVARRPLRLGLLATGLLAVGVTATGWGMWREFLEHGLPAVVAWAETFQPNYSVALLAARATGLPVALWTALLLGAAYGWCAWRRPGAATEFSVLTVAMLAGSVTVQTHYLVLLIFPVWTVWLGLTGRAWQTVAFAAALTLLNLLEPWEPVGLRWLNYLPVAGLVLLTTLLVAQSKKPAPA